jgi:hypothetical protein
LGIVAATHVVAREIRGAQCVCYLGDARPGGIAGRAGVQLVDPPERDDDWREVFAEVCVGDDGLIRRIAWSPKFGTRFRGGLLSRRGRLMRRGTWDRPI